MLDWKLCCFHRELSEQYVLLPGEHLLPHNMRIYVPTSQEDTLSPRIQTIPRADILFLKFPGFAFSVCQILPVQNISL